MTFVEAAVQILRREGKPLHVKELTRLAIKHNLLSVVGRDPEAMMETRLLIEAKRPSADLVRVSPGIFGLRTYPPRSDRGDAVKAEGEKVTKPKAEATATPAKERGDQGTKRRRSGRTTESAEAKAVQAEATVVEASEPTATASSEPAPVAAAKPTEPVVAEAKAAEAPAKPAAKSRRRTRGSAAEAKTAPVEAVPAAEPAPIAVATPAAAPAAVSDAAPVVESVAPPAAASAPSAATPRPVAHSVIEPSVPLTVSPILSPEVPAPPSAATPARSAAPAPSAATPAAAAPSSKTPAPAVPSSKTPAPAAPVPAAEPVKAEPAPPAAVHVSTKTPPPVERKSDAESQAEAPKAERPHSPAPREERAHREDRHGEHGTNQHRDERAQQQKEDRPAASANTPTQAGQSQPQQPRQMTLADAAYDVMRGASDGRALTHRQIAEIAVKRRLVRGELADVSRAVRVALVREQRHRDSEGLRPRIRNLGPGQYALGERKLEPELYNAERELLDRVSRTREATRVALRRRLRQLPPGAFELLMRLLLERLGMLGAEIVKRGEGVAYYGGTMHRGSRSLKVLVAVRPGEGELTKEAIAELRAGVRLRGFDEGMVLSTARAGAAAHAEVSAASGIELYDQDALTELLIKQHLGVRRMHLPVDYLDTELFNELLDQG